MKRFLGRAFAAGTGAPTAPASRLGSILPCHGSSPVHCATRAIVHRVRRVLLESQCGIKWCGCGAGHARRRSVRRWAEAPLAVAVLGATVGNQSARPGLCPELLRAHLQRSSGLADGPAPVALARPCSIEAREIVVAEPDPEWLSVGGLLDVQEAPLAPGPQRRARHAQLRCRLGR